MFNADLSVADLAESCPVCSFRTLHRWYLLEREEPAVFRGVHFRGRGRLWEWCSTCHTFEHYPDGFVPDWWVAPFVVREENLSYDPDPIELVRSGCDVDPSRIGFGSCGTDRIDWLFGRLRISGTKGDGWI